ncbi:relaxin-3a isoform X1 [Thunnus maccoyii]|uniref:relaxin-3a isoform X1 n=1 Tax=Thunnus maccoyii TaxID=8240 RepID=UPI001C4C8C67|nr:relaxin-3a isoform X1 [Thunnus maccoyii]
MSATCPSSLNFPFIDNTLVPIDYSSPASTLTLHRLTVVLAVCLLVAGVQPMEDPSYGVKLCGREFIRAVIFTCGGSRWKRSLRSTADVSEEDPFSSHQEESSEGLSHNSVMESLLKRNRHPEFLSNNNKEEVFSRMARSFITEEILEALRKADRKGRDVVVGLSNACCKWGCSKSEISSLC